MHEDSYLNVAKAKHRPVFIIGLEASESELIQRIKKRGIIVAQLLDELPGQLRDYKKATHDIKPDWSIVTSNFDNEIPALVEHLRTVVA